MSSKVLAVPSAAAQVNQICCEPEKELDKTSSIANRCLECLKAWFSCMICRGSATAQATTPQSQAASAQAQPAAPIDNRVESTSFTFATSLSGLPMVLVNNGSLTINNCPITNSSIHIHQNVFQGAVSNSFGTARSSLKVPQQQAVLQQEVQALPESASSSSSTSSSSMGIDRSAAMQRPINAEELQEPQDKQQKFIASCESETNKKKENKPICPEEIAIGEQVAHSASDSAMSSTNASVLPIEQLRIVQLPPLFRAVSDNAISSLEENSQLATGVDPRVQLPPQQVVAKPTSHQQKLRSKKQAAKESSSDNNAVASSKAKNPFQPNKKNLQPLPKPIGFATMKRAEKRHQRQKQQEVAKHNVEMVRGLRAKTPPRSVDSRQPERTPSSAAMISANNLNRSDVKHDQKKDNPPQHVHQYAKNFQFFKALEERSQNIQKSEAYIKEVESCNRNTLSRDTIREIHEQLDLICKLCPNTSVEMRAKILKKEIC